jgi:3-deoxy-D-manno-octulosonate 8-phosphate phosphatase (KDO 8-P phosphatase)
MNMDFPQVLTHIKAIVLDVDGVLTDGKIFADSEGNQLRTFHVRDGYAIKAALEHYKIAVISGGKDYSVQRRLEYLGIKDVFLGAKDKVGTLEDWCKKHHIQTNQVLGIGDDLPDYELLKTCGISFCPKDAVPEIKAIVTYILTQNGGEGCVREAIELLMKVNKQWEIHRHISST